MDTFKSIIAIIGGILLGVLIVGIFKDYLPSDGIAPVFIALIIFVGAIGLMFALVETLSKKFYQVSRKIQEKTKERNQQKEFNENIKQNLAIYEESKNTFQYFSDEKLLEIHNYSDKISSMEQLALEEELIVRNLIDHSPMHEKLYLLKKEMSE